MDSEIVKNVHCSPSKFVLITDQSQPIFCRFQHMHGECEVSGKSVRSMPRCIQRSAVFIPHYHATKYIALSSAQGHRPLLLTDFSVSSSLFKSMVPCLQCWKKYWEDRINGNIRAPVKTYINGRGCNLHRQAKHETIVQCG